MSVSSSLRRPLPSSRARLALPFVLTAAAAATACTVKSAEEPTAAPNQAQGEATPVIVSNPPHPQPTNAQERDRDPRTGAPTATPATAPTESSKPVIMRNPPPPRPVGEAPVKSDPSLEAKDSATTVKPTDTAKEYPKAPAAGGHVQVRDDGSCWWSAETKCPPKAACNPPPPTRVQCAGVKGPSSDRRPTAPAPTKAK